MTHSLTQFLQLNTLCFERREYLFLNPRVVSASRAAAAYIRILKRASTFYKVLIKRLNDGGTNPAGMLFAENAIR